MAKEKRIIILGGGPAGLGAAYRLAELGYQNFHLYEAEPFWGGLSASFMDPRGFTWDIGGHVLFSHYPYFDDLMATALSNEWLVHQRESWIWIENRFVPYPLQNHIHHLSPESKQRCLRDIEGLSAAGQQAGASQPKNFEEWILQNFGRGIADIFMLPYNLKVWAHPLNDMSCGWLGERVAPLDPKAILASASTTHDDPSLRSWGPNRVFQFPKHGGTGAIWTAVSERLPSDKRSLKTRATAIDRARKTVTLSDCSHDRYDHLISTIPIPEMLRITGMDKLLAAAELLVSNRTHVIGIGLKKPIPESLEKKCWIYFPEKIAPFYRATVFSNYSPHNVPDPGTLWSLMVEISSSSTDPANASAMIDSAIRGLVDVGFIESRKQVVSTWYYSAARGYPIPSLRRDEALNAIIPALEKHAIYSRGRFGGWKYEVGNQDHSCMQGVEIVNRLISGTPEVTFFNPHIANAPRRP